MTIEVMNIDEIRTLCDKYLDGETSLTEERILREWFTTTPLERIPEDIRDLAGMFTFFQKTSEQVEAAVQTGVDIVTAGTRPRHKSWARRHWYTILAVSGSCAAAVVAGLLLLHTPSATFTMKVDGVAITDQAQAKEFANTQLQKVAQMMGGLNRAQEKINDSGKRVINIMELMNK